MRVSIITKSYPKSTKTQWENSMFVKFEWVEISNFMSFGAATQRIDLANGQLNLILGDNLDNGKEGESKNGAGKSTILQAVLFALYGDGFADMKMDEFINLLNKKKLCVSVCFKIDNDEYIITRKRKPNAITVTKNEEPFTLSTSKNEDADIIQLIGYDSDIFMNTSMLTNNVSNFVYLKPAAQKAFIEKMFNINILSHRSDSLKAVNKNISSDYMTEHATIEANIASNTRLENMIVNLNEKSSSWESDKNTAIDAQIIKLAQFESVDIAANRIANDEVETLRIELGNVSLSVESLSKTIKSEIPKLQKHTSDLESLRAGQCPRCEQAWVSEEEILFAENAIDMINKSLDDIKEPLAIALSAESEVKVKLEAVLKDKATTLTEYQLSEIERSISDANNAIHQLKEQSIDPYTDQITEMSGNMASIDKTNLHNLSSLGDHYKFMIKLLTDSKSFIRKAIINQYVPIVNQYVNNYLSLLQSPHIFNLNDDLSMHINYMGRNVSMGMLSTGEKIRMSFAMSMAFRNFNGLTGHNSNILFIDEILDSGADVSGYNNIIDILKKVDMTVFVISHQDIIKSECDNILTVRKENGFSTVTLNE